MADIWKALPHYLENNAGLSVLVSDRIRPIRLKQAETLPAISFQDISSKYTQAHREPSALPFPRFQFTIFAGTVSSVTAVANALKFALSGYKGNMGIGSYLTIVEACLLKNEFSNDDPEIGVFQRFQDYVIQYKE